MNLRERKRERTRQALVDAASELFAAKGFEATTIAEIAARAEVGTRTFFSYFPTKEDVLFPESDGRVHLALAAIADREPGEDPASVLLRALGEAGDASDDMTGPLAAMRIELTQQVASVRGRALQLQWEAQREIALPQPGDQRGADDPPAGPGPPCRPGRDPRVDATGDPSRAPAVDGGRRRRRLTALADGDLGDSVRQRRWWLTDQVRLTWGVCRSNTYRRR